MSSDLFFYTSSNDEDEVNSELAFFTNACSAVIQASKPKITQNQFRMSRKLFTCIVQEMAYDSVPNALDEYLKIGAILARESLVAFCTTVMELYGNEYLRKPMYTDIKKHYARHEEKHRKLFTCIVQEMAYDSVPNALDEYLKIGAILARESLIAFCTTVMELYGNEYLRKPMYTDIKKHNARHEEKHGFPVMMKSIDKTDWPWENCPIALKAQFCRRDHGPDPFVLLEAIATQDLWI
nr:hypothetical protein [Tanacetum cinerariifolium]